MNENIRVEKLKEIVAGDAVSTGISIVIEGEIIPCSVYKIPLEYLVYNKYNGRIGTLVKSYETQHGLLNAENLKDVSKIEEFLFDSNKRRNNDTLKDLKKYKQLKHGIVTNTGKIIDGNRRAMLLNKIYKDRNEYNKKGEDVSWSHYFMAIILDDTISDDEKKIQELETLVQIGEDAKVDYNPIEKYLKCKELNKFAKVEDIAKWMNEDDSKVVKMLSVMDLMDDYLTTLDYSQIYTRLEKKEDQFIFLDDILKTYRKGSKYVKWDYDPDIDTHILKEICFDYIRADYEGKEFREIGAKSKGFFCNGNVWEEFSSNHMDEREILFDGKQEKPVEEYIKELPDAELTDILKARDNQYKELILPKLKKNMGKSKYNITIEKDSNEFITLLEKANKAVDSINRENAKYFESTEAYHLIKEINKKLWEDKKVFEKSQNGNHHESS